MSITMPDQAEVAIYGMRDSRQSDDVALASRKAVELGATVVSSLDAPQVRAIFNDITQAAAFAIWLGRRLVAYHTYQLTQVTKPTQPPWPQRDAGVVHGNCIRLARGYNAYARRHRLAELPQICAEAIAEAIARTPLHQLRQESQSDDTLPPSAA